MLEEISSVQFSEWMAFSRLEPFGYEIDLFGHAITASTIANVNRKKGKKAFAPKDFMPKEHEEKNALDFFKNLKAMLTSKNKDKQ